MKIIQPIGYISKPMTAGELNRLCKAGKIIDTIVGVHIGKPTIIIEDGDIQ